MREPEEIKANTVLYRPDYWKGERDGINLLIDPEGPNWIGTDPRGATILQLFDGKRTFDEVVRFYASRCAVETPKAWLRVHSFTRDLLRQRFLSFSPIKRTPYTSRESYLSLEGLKELWIHTNNSCNLECTHCLVDSGPSGDRGLNTQKIIRVMEEARELGVTQFYFTGGEPFLRPDIFQLIEHALSKEDSRLVILTNGTLFEKKVMERLRAFSPHQLQLQISLDGSSPKTNDPIRGRGTFLRIVKGIEGASRMGLLPTVSTVITRQNVKNIHQITRLAASLGASKHHFIFLHHRGRALREDINPKADIQEIIESLMEAKSAALEKGHTIDNFSFIRARVDGPKFTRYDLSNACWDSLCIYSNGEVYPSAALAGSEGLCCGNLQKNSLKDIWKGSPTCRDFREKTLQAKTLCRTCPIKFLCGGGDIEHSYFSSGGSLLGADPYCELYMEMIMDSIWGLVLEGKRIFNNNSGLDSAKVYRGMGEGPSQCETRETLDINSFQVRTLHSNCVLSFNSYGPRESVEKFYTQAAEEPQEELCCAGSYQEEDIAHIPQEALVRSYGCGSPIPLARIAPGETVLDLGSGAGIDCFIAARKVGPRGKVIGIDMTDKMLDIARRLQGQVTKNLGYDVVSFKKGLLEEIPVDSGTVDLVLSNCVINLSPEKKRVFTEIWRVLKNHGRTVISDIVSQGEVPSRVRQDKNLWGQCLGGALTEEEFLTYLEQAGFYGLEVLKKTYWKEAEGCRFFSITVRGYKYEKRPQCTYRGHKAVYLGPLKAVIDEEGHLFPRGEAIEVCTDTAERLKQPPYSSRFIVIDPSENATDDFICSSGDDKKCCG